MNQLQQFETTIVSKHDRSEIDANPFVPKS